MNILNNFNLLNLKLKTRIYNFILTHFIGWVIKGNSTFSKLKIKKAILIAAPHTHWMDLFLGILIRGSLGFKSSFIAKKELFFFPLSIFLKLIGGIPVNRDDPSELFKKINKLTEKSNGYLIAMAPEGTRKKVNKLKSGFIRIAKQTNSKILLAGIDLQKKFINRLKLFMA